MAFPRSGRSSKVQANSTGAFSITPHVTGNPAAHEKIALLATLVVGANYLSSRHWLRGDWTAGRTFSLSDKTTALVRSLPRDVEVIVFMLPTGEL